MKLVVDKRALWRLVNKRINRVVHHYHVFSVISFLIEEMINDLKCGKEIKIDNLGTIKLKKSRARYFKNLFTQEICYSNGKNYVKFMPSLKLKRKLLEYIDFEKTFPPTI